MVLKALTKAALQSVLITIAVLITWLLSVYNKIPLPTMLGIDLSMYKPTPQILHRPPLPPLPYGKGITALIALTVVSSLAPLARYVRKRAVEVKRVKEETYSFMRVLSSYVRSGLGLMTILRAVSDVIRPPLRDRITLYSSLLSLGLSSEEAFERAFGDLPRDVKSILYTVVIAFRAGGRAPDIIDYAASFIAEIRAFEEIKESRLAQYIYIIIIACIAFAVSAVVMTLMLSYISGMGQALVQAGINIEYLFSVYFYAALLIIVFSSIAIGRSLRGYTPLAIYYAFIMILIISLIFILGPMFIKF